MKHKTQEEKVEIERLLNLKFAEALEEEKVEQESESSEENEEKGVNEKKEDGDAKDEGKTLEVDYYSFRKYLPKRVH